MQSISVYVLPVLVIILLVVCIIKKVRAYDCFLLGAKDSLTLVWQIFPYIASIFVCIELFKASGLSGTVTALLAKPLGFIGVPSEIVELILLVPLSGNGTTALLEDIIARYGADSYITRCASVIAGGSETVFYISAVYFATTKTKKLRHAIPVSLFCTLVGALLACALCRIM